MQPDPTKLLDMTGITTPLIGLYDAPDTAPFEPFAKPKHCFFACYENWTWGESVCVSKDNYSCPGAGYWLCGMEFMTREKFVKFLWEKEGLKSTPELTDQWLDNNPPYKRKHSYIIIGPLRESQWDYIRTITFFVNPDQLSLLITGAEYFNASPETRPVIAPFGSGCGQQVALFENPEEPKAMIGGTDIAMRQYLPPDILAFTVTKAMFKSLCELDEKSFLYKPFCKRLKKAREKL